MKKSLLICVLALTLLISGASAAPTRWRGEALGLSDAELMALQPLLGAAASAAFERNIPSYLMGSAPPQALVETVLARALAEGMFPVDRKGQSLMLSDAKAREMAGQLFAWQDLPAITAPLIPGTSRSGDGLQFDLSEPESFVGLYAYASRQEADGLLLVRGDAYRLVGAAGLAEDAPEDSLIWIGHLSLWLQKAANTPAGYTLAGFEVNERYQAGGLRQIIDEENGYELSYPDIFPAPGRVPGKGEGLSLTSGDGIARLTVSFVPGSLDSLEAAWQAEAGSLEGGRVRRKESGQLALESAREMRLALMDEKAGQCVVLSCVFPGDRPCEQGLYWEFMENSFVVYAHAAG